MSTGKQFTYNGDPASSPVNEVRFLIGDTIRSRPMFGDTEIAYQLTKTPNAKLAGAELLEIKSRQFARLADEKVGDVSKAFSKVATQMKECAKQLRADAVRLVGAFFGGLTKSGKQSLALDPDAVQPAFPLGITDDPTAVQLNKDYASLLGLVGPNGVG